VKERSSNPPPEKRPQGSKRVMLDWIVLGNWGGGNKKRSKKKEKKEHGHRERSDSKIAKIKRVTAHSMQGKVEEGQTAWAPKRSERKNPGGRKEGTRNRCLDDRKKQKNKISFQHA